MRMPSIGSIAPGLWARTQRAGRTAPHAALAAAMGLVGLSCAGTLPAANLRPDALGKGQGAFFGHIKVYNRHRNVTGTCHVAFTDERGETKTVLTLDESGWVFASASEGPTHLSDVTCAVGEFFKHVAGYSTRDFRFTVRGGSDLVYFGDVVVEMHVGGKGATAAGLFGGEAGC